MPKPIIITQDKLFEYYSRHLNGESIKDLSNDLNIYYETLSKIFKKNNLKIIKKNDVYWRLKDKICELYDSGLSLNDISKVLNIPATAAYRVLKKSKIVMKKYNSEYTKKLRKYNIDSEYFKQINNQDKAYILGFLYADGNAHKKHYHIKLKLQEADKEILLKINMKLNHNKPLYFTPKIRNSCQNQYSLLISNKEIYNDLLRWGVVPNKTFKLKFPDFLADNLYSHFVRGYFDGDGSIYLDKKRNVAAISIIGTTSFCLDLSKLFKSMDISNQIQHDRRCSLGIDVLRIRRKKDIIKTYNWMYDSAELFLFRKYNKFLEIL